ncbi:hypothetical protein AK88_01859 [Plasmodium fragile]|uniref:Schizont-infected cell agglutination extracellular alpha domain-containing protein n=1 Tax=Plasmodium fragile TaxID=5857 RepID=A0A0D9QNM9_PLAFR|nr:uncharacterized protein AK88_01859 [Plasmodium fragile]KJP88407.1 hypothetical protein AK88_01859 [Plasmodium fragile]
MEQKNELNEAYGANCYNSGWDDFGTGKHHHRGQTVADVVRCRVMSVAWVFANGWGTTGSANTDGVEITQEERNMFRCEVANIFGHLLKAKYCPRQSGFKRGVEYSRIAFQKMNSPGPHEAGNITGPVIEGKCTACGYGEYQRWANAINLKVVEWLMEHAHINEEIKRMQEAMPCTTQWTHYIKQLDPQHNPIKDGDRDWTSIKAHLSAAGNTTLETAEKDMEGEVKKIIEKVKDAKDQILQKAKEASAQVQKNAQKDATETTRKNTICNTTNIRPILTMAAYEYTAAHDAGHHKNTRTRGGNATHVNYARELRT